MLDPPEGFRATRDPDVRSGEEVPLLVLTEAFGLSASQEMLLELVIPPPALELRIALGGILLTGTSDLVEPPVILGPSGAFAAVVLRFWI